MWLRKADFVTGIGLALFGLTVLGVTLTFRWDLASVRQAGWYTAPGILPAAAAVLLVAQGVALAAKAVPEGGRPKRQDLNRVRLILASTRVRRVGLAALLLSVYVFILVGRVHFTLASFLFLAAFMFLFRAAAWWKVLLISGVASAAVSYGFSGIAGVPLP